MSSHGSVIHFFKKIEEDTLRSGELRIPRSFVTKCWDGISNPVLLLLPNRGRWKVKWKNLDADIWLIDNWKNLAEFYSLDQDHLLVFRYSGKSQFEVVILDQSGLEIVYPLKEGTSDSDNDNPSRQSKRAKSPLPFCPTTKKVKNNPRKELNSQDVETILPQSQRTKVHADDFDIAMPKKRGTIRTMHANTNRTCSKSKENQIQKLSALERANAFRSPNKCCICEMKPSYIQRHVLAIPRNFITEYQLKKGGWITLLNSEDTIWSVKLCVNPSNGQKTIGSGWRDFAKDNNLELGNVCVFEKIKSRREFSLRVSIFRDDGEESRSPSMIPASEDGTNPSNRTRLQNVIAKRGSDAIPNNSKGKNVFDDSEDPRLNNETSEQLFTLFIKPNNQLCHEGIHDNDNVNNITLRIGETSLPVRLSR